MFHMILTFRLISKNPEIAKEAANILRDRLVTIRPGNESGFESSLLGDFAFMRDLNSIADDQAPACIWQKHGRTAHMFRFVADRFLGAPDSVGGCESIHAQWKWLEINRRNLKFQMLNALLRLRNYITTFGELPSFDELQDHIETVYEYQTALYNTLRTEGVLDREAVRAAPYRDRFNLGCNELLLVDAADEEDAVADIRNVDVAWANYVRFLFEPHNVFCLTALPVQRFFYVAENKSVAYRDAPKYGEAIGRPISLIWLEKAIDPDRDDAHDQEQLFIPVSSEIGDLHVADLSLAEISLAAGYYPHDVQLDSSDRDVEVLHERRFLDHNVERFASNRISASNAVNWLFLLDVSSGADIEHWSYETRDMGQHTKMSLARQLQARDNLTDAVRAQIWTLPRATLLASIAHPAAAAAVPGAVAGAVAGAAAAAVPAAHAARGGARGVGASGGARGRARGGAGAGRARGGGPGGRGHGRGRGRGRG